MATLWLPPGQRPALGQQVDWQALGLPFPAGEWWMNEGVGNVVYDASGNSNHGAITGTVWSPTPYGSGLSYDGSGDVVTVPHSDTLSMRDDSLTVAVWFQSDLSTGYRTMVKKDKSYILRTDLTALMFYFWASNMGVAKLTNFAPTGLGTWHLAVGTVTRGAGTLYLDGAAVASSSAKPTGYITTNPLCFGAAVDAGEGLIGGLSGVLIWPIGFSAEQVQQLLGSLPIMGRFPFVVSVGGTAYTLTLTDSLGMGESLHKGAGLSLVDSLGMGDLAGKGAGHALTDSLGLSDAIARAAGKALVDQVGLSELLNRATARALADTWAASDTVSKEAGRAFADTVALSDTITTLRVLLLALTDSLGMTDTVSRAAAVTYAETIGLSDTLSKLVGVTFADLLSLADSILKYNPSTSTTARVTLAITLARTIIDATLSRLTLDIRQDEV